MQSRHILALLGVLIVAGVAWFALQTGGSTNQPDSVTQTLPTRQVEPAAGAAELAGVDAAAADRSRTVEEAVAAPMTQAAAEGDHPWAGMLAGLTGRIVEKDGTPVAKMRVELIEADLSVLYSAEHAALGGDELEIGETFTGADGTFLLDGARDGAFHALNIDRGGGRATIRLVEQSVEHGALTDLGDIVLDEYGTLIGVVIDEDGEPVPGARVRATVLPEIVMQTGVLDARPGIVVTANEAEGFAFEPPPSAFSLLDRLPIPTTTTLADGSFRLEGVPLGSVSGGVDLEGHVAAIIGPVNMTATEVDVGELELLYGRTVTGTVTDQMGEPVSGVQVCAGAYHPIFKVAIMQPGSVTDEAGQYSLRAMPETGKLVAGFKRHRSEAWMIQESVGAANVIDFVMPTAGTITCTVVDEEDEPLEGATVSIRLAAAEGNEMAWMTNMMAMGRKPAETTKAKKTATPGVYTVSDIALGNWLVEARAPGRAVVREEVKHEGGDTQVKLRAVAGKNLRVTVVDAITGQPVSRAHATLLGPEGFLMTAFASAFTDEEGAAKLGPLAPSYAEDAVSEAVWMKDIVVSVEHPKFGMAKATVEADATEIRIEMPPTCTVQGRVSWAGAAPGQLYMVALRWDDDQDAIAQATMLPRTALTNLDGNFKVTGLAPGQYSVYLMERYFEGNPIQILVDQKEPTMVDERKVVAKPEEPAELEFELSPSGMGPSGAFEGLVMLDGSPVSGAEVKVGRRDPDILYTDGLGRFRTEPYPVIETQRISIEAEVPLPDGSVEKRQVYQEWKRPKRDEVTEIEVNLSFTPMAVEVVDAATGAAIPDVKLRLSSGRGWRGRRGGDNMKTDSEGRASTVLPDDKSYTVTAENEFYAKASAKVSAATLKESDGVLRIEMMPEVPCSGTVALPDDMAENGGKMWVNVTSPGYEGNWAPIDPDDMTFEFTDMAPGEYEAQIWSGPRGGMVKATFVLPPGGSTNLVLEFVREEG